MQQHQQGQGEWLEVRHRRIQTVVVRKSVWTAKRGKDVGEAETLSTFFLTEFSDSFQAKEMFEVFKVFGLVVEVVIPPRRNKKGKQYGFVRFRKVGDERVMAVELDNIHIQGKKLFANIPRFQRGTQVVPPEEKK